MVFVFSRKKKSKSYRSVVKICTHQKTSNDVSLQITPLCPIFEKQKGYRENFFN